MSILGKAVGLVVASKVIGALAEGSEEADIRKEEARIKLEREKKERILYAIIHVEPLKMNLKSSF